MHPKTTLWTYGAINTHVPCTPKAREPKHFQKKPFGGQRGFSRSVSISRSYKPSFQVEGQGNHGESLEKRLLCKAREQIQLKRLRRRRISGISDAIKAEHHQLRRISIDFHQGSSIEARRTPIGVLSRRAQFGVVVLQDSQRQRAKETHKHSMAKKRFNESRKSTIQNTSALTAHSMRSEHSSSSLEHKSSNKSKRSGKSTPDSFVYSDSDSNEDE
ncbi:hypothetical protein Taro_053317, partial [Colocasia esculenta]|nr:hypothetical protein [Colocasia esculenta]